jgi:RNA polymerase sigma-70 factor (ECF subfamily)
MGNLCSPGVVTGVENLVRTGGTAVTPEDVKLAERARNGDVAAYERLVREYESLAFRAAFVITGDSQEAEDAVQEALVKAYRSMKRFRPGAPFRPWLMTIVANEARNRRKAAGRRTSLALRVAEESVAGNHASPEAAAMDSERRAELLRALEGLREEDRQAIACRYFLGLSEAETAAALGCAKGTVKSRTSRALGRLRERMAGEDAG